MEAPPFSTCVVLYHWKDGGGEADTAVPFFYSHLPFGGGQRWSIPSPCGKCLETGAAFGLDAGLIRQPPRAAAVHHPPSFSRGL